MRIAYLGNFGPTYSTENIVARALEANGHSVDRIQEGDTRALDVRDRIAEQMAELFLWTQTYGLAETGGTNDERLYMVQRIRDLGVPSVGYHLDKWWGVTGDGRMDRLAWDAFFRLDRVVTADGGPHPWADHGIEHRWFPPGVDETECVPGEVRSEIECGVTFVGGWTRAYHRESRHRHELIAHLQRRWRRELRLVPRDGRTRVNGQALRDVYASAKVVVGDSCLVPNAPRYWSDRIPETIGRGGFLIHPYVEGIEDHFTDGKHLRLWQAGDWAELDRLISYYIAHDDERRAIAEEGRRHVLEHHTYTVRMRQLVAMLRDEGLLQPITIGEFARRNPGVFGMPEPAQWPVVGETGPEQWAPPTSGTVHPNNMAAWDAIGCQRGHDHHAAHTAIVDLAAPHGYADLTPVPRRLARRFDMAVWDARKHPVDGGPYCPAHDAVSETIVNQGIWEPAETVLTLSACLATVPTATVVDFGAQVGWFSLLAASCGLEVTAIEADRANVSLLEESAEANGWGGLIAIRPERIGPTTPPLEPNRTIALAKVDVEGAERDAVRMLWPSIEAGLVQHLLVEVTPAFDGYYPDLVADLVAAGYRAYVLPPKSHPPTVLDRLPADLEPFRIDTLDEASMRELVASWSQEMVWFARPEAAWA